MRFLYKTRLPRLIIGGVVFFTALILFEAVKLDMFALSLALYITAYLITGADVVYAAVRNIFRGKVFDENFLMTIATVGAFCIFEFPEAVAVMLFYQVGELFQNYAVNKSRRSIKALVGIRPDYANLVTESGDVRVDPEDIAVGDTILIRPGERVALDGVVLSGRSSLDTAALTGESLPREIGEGEEILSGCVNLTGVLTVKVSKPFGESTVSRILELVENAAEKKSRQENFITKFAKYYTPAVVLAALVIALLPPAIAPKPTFLDAFMRWLHTALTFLVVSCPCALVVSIPMSFFGGMGGASRNGILVKGSGYLEALANAGIVVFDKTGTLTKGEFKVVGVYPEQGFETQLLHLAASAEQYSDHPIGKAIKLAYENEGRASASDDVQEIPGRGITATVDGRKVLAGNALHLIENGVDCAHCDDVGTVVYVAADGRYAGRVVIADEIKSDAAEAIAALKSGGIRKTVMLSGDKQSVAESVAAALSLDEVQAELLPSDKLVHIERIIAEKRKGEGVIYVGDGINDAPVLTRADVGIAMGALGADAAIESADVVIMTDELKKIPLARRIAKKTLRIALQNIVFALAVKLGIMVVSIFYPNMWLAVFADVGVAVLAILNALRALSTKGIERNDKKAPKIEGNANT